MSPPFANPVGATIGRPQCGFALTIAAAEETKNGRPMVAPTPVERKRPASPHTPKIRRRHDSVHEPPFCKSRRGDHRSPANMDLLWQLPPCGKGAKHEKKAPLCKGSCRQRRLRDCKRGKQAEGGKGGRTTVPPSRCEDTRHHRTHRKSIAAMTASMSPPFYKSRRGDHRSPANMDLLWQLPPCGKGAKHEKKAPLCKGSCRQRRLRDCKRGKQAEGGKGGRTTVPPSRCASHLPLHRGG